MKYAISIISYFDILGFKDIIETRKPKDILNILKRFRYMATPDKELSKDLEQNFFNFSDCAVRTTKVLSRVNSKRPVGILFYELLDVLHIQMELVNLGIFLRGGITLGEVYAEDGFIFGPGLVDAYVLENKIAKSPRIILQKEVVDLISDVPALRLWYHKPKEELDYIKDLIKLDSDGYFFIDYLKAMNTEVEPEDYFSFLVNHRNNIKANLLRFKSDSHNFEKYAWLKDYHNSSICEMKQGFFKSFGSTKSKLII
ncbi:MAG: hypothetical protein C4517_06330 [Stygiobacter sp.]|nr:MAG: hypothetical protein C4517_06330 [Stygiobacter sp.]